MYYNKRQERLERKKIHYRKLESETLSDDKRKELFRENLQEGFSRAKYRQAAQKSSNIRIFILIGIIVVLGYFIFNGVDEVDLIVKKLW